MKIKLFALGLLTALFALPACEDETSGQPGGGNGDGGVGNSVGMVVSQYKVPTTEAEAKNFAYDIDGDGTVDNALGTILAALKAVAPGLDLQKEMDQNVQNGNVIMLMSLTADNLTASSSATLQTWTGKEKLCCSAKPCSATDAKQNCFSGANEHEPEVNSASNAVLNGAIAGATGTFGPGTVEVELPIGLWTARVKLLKAKVIGAVSATGMVDGKLAGAIAQTDLKNQVIPAVAKVLDGEMKDPTTSQANKDAIKKAFDADKDGNITAAEVEANAAVKAVMSGDVDADGDGKKEELSAAVGFTAVGAKIKTP
jgi:hypothetical protein